MPFGTNFVPKRDFWLRSLFLILKTRLRNKPLFLTGGLYDGIRNRTVSVLRPYGTDHLFLHGLHGDYGTVRFLRTLSWKSIKVV